MNIHDFTVTAPKKVLPVMVGLVLVSVVIIVLLLIDNPIVPLSLPEEANNFLKLFLAFHLLVSFLMIVLFGRRKIKVKDGNFQSVSGFGSVIQFTLEDIKRIKYEMTEYEVEAITLYSEHDVLAMATAKQPGYDLLLEYLHKQGLMKHVKGLSPDIVEVT